MRYVIDEKMIIQHWWNDNDCGKPKKSNENLSLCQSVDHKSHMDLHETETEPGPPR
jgi:hypothetical protein